MPRRENIRWARSREEGRRSYEADLMERVRQLVNESLDRIGIDALAAALALSPHHLMRLFRRSSVVSIHEYILRRRIAKARELLCTSEVTVLEIGMSVGFESPSAFYAAFSRIIGMPPGEFRNRTKAEVPQHGA